MRQKFSKKSTSRVSELKRLLGEVRGRHRGSAAFKPVRIGRAYSGLEPASLDHADVNSFQRGGNLPRELPPFEEYQERRASRAYVAPSNCCSYHGRILHNRAFIPLLHVQGMTNLLRRNYS